DINQLNTMNGVIDFIRQSNFLTALAILGSILAPIIFLGSVVVAVSAAMPARYRFWKHLGFRRSAEPAMLVDEAILEESRLLVEENQAQGSAVFKSFRMIRRTTTELPDPKV